MSDGSVVIEVELTKEQLEQGLKSLNKDLEKIKKPTKSITDNLTKGLDSVGKVATKTGTALTAGLTTPLIALGTAGVKYNAQMEDFEANLTTLLGSADKAKDMLNDLKEMANTTPFETTDLLDATQTMLGFGLEANKTKGYLQMLGDVSMGNAEKLKSLTLAFSQIGASGKATMEDINQMIGAGFNPLFEISQKTGKSIGELRDEVSAGKISFEDIAGAMEIATSEGGRFYKSMENAAGTMNGKLSSAMDALKTALGELTQSLLPVVTKAVEKITEWANAFANLDQETQETILKIAGIVAIAGPALIVFGQIANGISTLITGFGKLKTAFSTGGAGIKAFSSALTFLTSPAGIVIAVITAIIAIMVVLYNKSEKFRNVVNAGLEQIKNALLNLWNKVQPALQQLGEAFMGLLEKLKPVGEFLVTVLSVAFTVVTNALTILIDIIAEVITFFVNLVTTIIEFFTVTIPNAFNSFISFWTQLGENIKNTFINAWNAIVNFFTETIPQWIQNVITWFQELPRNIGILIGQMFGHIANFGLDVWNWITVELPKIIQGIIDWFAQLPGNIWNWLCDVVTKIGEWGKNTWNTATTWVANTINGIIDWFSQLPGRIWTWLTNTINNVITWGQNLANKGKEASQNLFNNIVDTIQNLPSKLTEIGKNLIEGLWNGITGMGDWLKEKISSFAGGIIEGFKETFQIHSPSKVMNKEIGRYLALGLGEGFNDNIKSVYSKMKSAVDFETQKLSANLTTQATLKASKDNVRTVNNDNGTTINNTQNFYEKNTTPYEQQKQAKQQLRRLAYGL